MGILNELKERRLVQIVFSYLAAGWIFLEVVDQFVERSVLPEVTYYVVLIWFLAGIPAAFLIGWNHGEKGIQKAPRSEIAFVSILALVALGFSGFTVDRLGRPPVDLSEFGLNPNRVAVLYFEDHSPGAVNQHIANGLTETLIEQLASVRGLDVIGRNGVATFQGHDVSRDSIGTALEAGTLVGGVLERVGEGLQVTLQLYDGASGAPVPDGRLRLEPRHPDSLMQVMEQVGEEASRLLRVKLGDHVRIARRSAETNLTAWTLVQRAEKLRRDGHGAAEHGDLHGAFDSFDQAHTILARAQEADTLWARPTTLRSVIDYDKSRLTAARVREAAGHADSGLQHAQHALEIDPANAEALGSRGTLRYWKYLLNVVHDDYEQDRLLDGGREDLERAIRLDPTLASALSVLSHLYYRVDKSTTRGILAAQRAYDADAYLEAADGVVWRLFTGNFDLENWTEARKWCEIGRKRFPDDVGFLGCHLNLMVAGVLDPDPDEAWRIARQVEVVASPQQQEFERVNALMSVAGVLGRAGHQDSARVVLDRAAMHISDDVDVSNDLLWREASVRVLLGQHDSAIAILGRLIAADPDHAFGSGAQIGWEWRPLMNHPAFESLRRVGG